MRSPSASARLAATPRRQVGQACRRANPGCGRRGLSGGGRRWRRPRRAGCMLASGETNMIAVRQVSGQACQGPREQERARPALTSEPPRRSSHLASSASGEESSAAGQAAASSGSARQSASSAAAGTRALAGRISGSCT